MTMAQRKHTAGHGPASSVAERNDITSTEPESLTQPQEPGALESSGISVQELPGSPTYMGRTSAPAKEGAAYRPTVGVAVGDPPGSPAYLGEEPAAPGRTTEAYAPAVEQVQG